MAELDSETIAESEAVTPEQLVEHTSRVLATAEDVLHRVNNLEVFKSFEMGQKTLKRSGAARNVHYIEVADGSGPKLRIEVFVV